MDSSEEVIDLSEKWAQESQIKFSEREIMELAISIAVLTIAFSFLLADNMLFLVRGDILPLIHSLVIVCTAFVFHELGHKFMAQRYGLWAEYRMWTEGLIFALILPIITMGKFIFAAPGAVYISGFNISRSVNGITSLIGPVINIILGIIFFIGLMILSIVGATGFLSTLCSYGVVINLWLALFNMFPFPPLDGAAVIKWSPLIWSIITIPLALMFIFLFFG